jgi:hypothetical protein
MKTVLLLVACISLIALTGCGKPDVGPHNKFQQQLDASDRAQRNLERQ